VCVCTVVEYKAREKRGEGASQVPRAAMSTLVGGEKGGGKNVLRCRRNHHRGMGWAIAAAEGGCGGMDAAAGTAEGGEHQAAADNKSVCALCG
jgi:hypothetical protein